MVGAIFRAFLLISSLPSFQQSLFDSSTCGLTKQCFVPCTYNENPATCFAVVSTNFHNISGTFFLDIELFTRNFTQAGHYMAVALGSKDQEMRNTFVSECSAIGDATQMTAKLSYNNNGAPNPANTRIPGLSQDDMNKILTNFSIQEADGDVYCRFTQQINNLPVFSDQIYNYRIGDENYLLFARGMTGPDGLYQHASSDRDPSTYLTKIGRVMGVDCPTAYSLVDERGLCVGTNRIELNGWDDAQQSCQTQGGTLAIIRDAFFNSALVQWAIGSKYGSKYQMMIGLRKNGTDWVWSDGSRADYLKWATGEPKAGTDCALLDPSNGNWYGDRCNNWHIFLCQIPVSQNV